MLLTTKTTRVIITSGQNNLTKGRIATTHGRFSRIRQVVPICTSSAFAPYQFCTSLSRFEYIDRGYIRASAISHIGFWATVCKMVCPIPSDHCLSVCPVCDVCVLWPNGLMDQDETWHACRPRPWPPCVTWGPSSPSHKRAQPPIFRPISVVVGWIKMPLGMEVGLGSGDLC